MPEYPETVVQATTSRRMFAVHLQVPLGDPAGRSVLFEEEAVIVVGTTATRSRSGTVSARLVGSDSFALLNPSTGAPLGSTATHGDLYRLLYSLYVDLSNKRDAAPPELP